MNVFNIKKPRINNLGNLETLGYIHSTESFGSVDGPGIRFVVFMQGCILKCKYCHNRDTWEFKKENKYTPSMLLSEIKKYENYYKSSNGGITFSGGEPLAQPKFLLDSIRLLKQNGFHIAIDTSGFFKITKDIEEILKLTNLVLLDIKHIDKDKCKELVGMTNDLNIEFLNYLEKINKKVWIRQVIIPGITDDEKDLRDLREFLSKFTCIENIELLPYSDFGKYKWENLGFTYPLEGVRIANYDDIKRAKEILNLKENKNGLNYIEK